MNSGADLNRKTDWARVSYSDASASQTKRCAATNEATTLAMVCTELLIERSRQTLSIPESTSQIAILAARCRKATLSSTV
jgi:hypothetical protein